MKKYLIILFILILSTTAFAGYFDDTDWVDYYYGKEGEPDYADGDLEDKLGDSGYYYDLFPEERDEEDDDDYAPSNSGYTFPSFDPSTFKNVDTRVFKYVFPDGSSIGLTRTQYEKMKNQFFAGAFEKNGNIYYRYYNGDLRTGWVEEKGNWFYFDKNTGAMVKNQLVEYEGKFYYLNLLGIMATNTEVVLNGVALSIDEKGVCTVKN